MIFNFDSVSTQTDKSKEISVFIKTSADEFLTENQWIELISRNIDSLSTVDGCAEIVRLIGLADRDGIIVLNDGTLNAHRLNRARKIYSAASVKLEETRTEAVNTQSVLNDRIAELNERVLELTSFNENLRDQSVEYDSPKVLFSKAFCKTMAKLRFFLEFNG